MTDNNPNPAPDKDEVREAIESARGQLKALTGNLPDGYVLVARDYLETIIAAASMSETYRQNMFKYWNQVKDQDSRQPEIPYKPQYPCEMCLASGISPERVTINELNEIIHKFIHPTKKVCTIEEMLHLEFTNGLIVTRDK